MVSLSEYFDSYGHYDREKFIFLEREIYFNEDLNLLQKLGYPLVINASSRDSINQNLKGLTFKIELDNDTDRDIELTNSSYFIPNDWIAKKGISYIWSISRVNDKTQSCFLSLCPEYLLCRISENFYYRSSPFLSSLFFIRIGDQELKTLLSYLETNNIDRKIYAIRNTIVFDRQRSKYIVLDHNYYNQLNDKLEKILEENKRMKQILDDALLFDEGNQGYQDTKNHYDNLKNGRDN